MATYTTDKIEFGGNVYKLQDSDALPLAGGNVTGPVNFGDSVTMEEASVGDIVITGNASATNNLQVNTINGEEVGSTPKFTDTVTTVSTTGSGNAVTAISASNGAITATKGTTFLTSHQDISGKADKSATVSTVAWDSTNKKLTKTINGTTSDVVTAATLRTGLNVADGAEVNQNAFSSIMGFTGSTPFVPDSENASISAQTKTSTAYIHAGNNINITDYIGFTTNPSTEVSGIQISAKDTTYESKTAASGGTDVSLVTTGEKYTWNNKLASHQTIKQDGITGATINRYGVCDTAAATAEKTVSITTGTFTLETGAKVTVNFTNKNTADNPTLNVNSTGAKNIFHNGVQITTGTNKGMLYGTVEFVYDGTQWQLIGNYVDNNTDTIGYRIRTNSRTLPVSGQTGRYRLLFISSDHTHFVPANTLKSTSNSTIKTVNQEKIDPFGEIIYYESTAVLAANNYPNKTVLWQQSSLPLGYSFNTTGEDLTLTDNTPVYIKCTPQTDGSVIIDPTTPYTQTLPSVQDGKVYIFLGIATSSTVIEMVLSHPVYEYKNGQVRQWTNAMGALDGAITTTATEITVNKPLKFDYPNGWLNFHAGGMDSNTNLNNIAYTIYGWCDNVVNKPVYTGRWGYFICFEVTQFYLDYDSTGMIPYVRSNVNNEWTPWRCLIENDWHSDTAAWDNSKGLLNLGRQYNGRWIRVAQTASDYPSDSPYGAQTAVYYRYQIMDYVNNTLQWALIELHEVFPVSGRIISIAYDYGQNGWLSWKFIDPHS